MKNYANFQIKQEQRVLEAKTCTFLYQPYTNLGTKIELKQRTVYICTNEHCEKSSLQHKFAPYKNLGFTLIELLIAIAIVGILMTIAIPSYQQYTKKAHYSEIVQATAPYKLGIEECYQTMGTLDNCGAGQNGVPTEISSGDGVGLVDSVSIEDDDKIVVTPRDIYGIKPTDIYELTPTENNNQLTWKSSGEGVNKGYAD